MKDNEHGKRRNDSITLRKIQTKNTLKDDRPFRNFKVYVLKVRRRCLFIKAVLRIAIVPLGADIKEP